MARVVLELYHVCGKGCRVKAPARPKAEPKRCDAHGEKLRPEAPRGVNAWP